MINKTNNISFKKAILTPSLYNVGANGKKLDIAIEVINKYYPQNDVFLSADESGELIYQIQKAEPLTNLLQPYVMENLKTVEPQEFIDLIKYCLAYKAAYNKLHNIKNPAERYQTKDINRMGSLDIARTIKYSLDKFNNKYPQKLN